jgi:transcriptional adapter 2-alpha
MPGRLEFDHEVENEAEVVIKDMDFGLIYSYGGDEMREGPPPAGGRDAIGEEAEGDDGGETRAAPRTQQQSTKTVAGSTAGKTSSKGVASKQPLGNSNGIIEKFNKDDMDVDEAEDDEDEKPLAQLVDAVNHEVKRDTNVKPKNNGREKGEDKEVEGDAEEEDKTPAVVLEMEDPEDLELKLTVLEVYYSRLAKRQQIKDFIFDRGLMDYKRVSQGRFHLKPFEESRN